MKLFLIITAALCAHSLLKMIFVSIAKAVLKIIEEDRTKKQIAEIAKKPFINAEQES